MFVLAVAGGLGDFGRLIVDALLAKNKYEVYILTRKIPPNHPKAISPLSGKEYSPLIQTDYTSEQALSALLTKHKIHTIICTFGIDWPEAAAAQCLLIRAAASSPNTKRFIPSEYNVDYDLDDSILPYPEKKFHTMARRELEKTHLEYTYVYPGMFMDYFGLPNLDTHMRPLYIILDISHGVAVVPGDGNTKIAVSYTKDVARYITSALELEKWPRVLTVVAESVTSNELVALAEKTCGKKLRVTYETVERLRNRQIEVLPGNKAIASNFPGGMQQLEALLADLSAAMALGAYDFGGLKDCVDLVREFEGKEEKMMGLEEFLGLTWGANLET